MNRKQQRIKVRQIKEQDAMNAYTIATVIRDESAKRIAASRLILNSQLSQADIFMLNTQLLGKSSREQINTLELWFDWAETAAKVKAQEALTREERGTRFVIELLQFRARGQRELLETC